MVLVYSYSTHWYRNRDAAKMDVEVAYPDVQLVNLMIIPWIQMVTLGYGTITNTNVNITFMVHGVQTLNSTKLLAFSVILILRVSELIRDEVYVPEQKCPTRSGFCLFPCQIQTSINRYRSQM